MAIIGKTLVVVLTFAAAYFFSYWVLFVQILSESVPWLATAAALLTATVLAGLVWCGTSAGTRGTFATAMTWAAVAGAIAFCGGFFGPLIFAPEANQGPLLGLFITGPLGFAGGALAGLIHALWRRSQASMGDAR